MHNVYLLHGCCDKDEFNDLSVPSGSNFHWFPWLQKQLIVQGYNCQTPEFPTPYKPSYHRWKEIFDCFPIDEQTTLVGHSCGGGFLLRYLADTQQGIKKLILVAPWLDPHKKVGDFLQFDLPPALANQIGAIDVFYSTDEPVTGVKESVEKIRQTYSKTIYHEFTGQGHFCLSTMKTDAFPELLQAITT